LAVDMVSRMLGSRMEADNLRKASYSQIEDRNERLV